MSTEIVLPDGRAMITSNGIYDSLIEAIVSTIDGERPRGPLGAWLLDQRCLVRGPGVSGFSDLIYLGDDGVAFLGTTTSGADKLWILRSPLIATPP